MDHFTVKTTTCENFTHKAFKYANASLLKTLNMCVDYCFTTNRMGWFRLHAVYPMVKQADYDHKTKPRSGQKDSQKTATETQDWLSE